MNQKPFKCKSCNKELMVSVDRYERDYGGQDDCMTCREWRLSAPKKDNKPAPLLKPCT